MNPNTVVRVATVSVIGAVSIALSAPVALATVAKDGTLHCGGSTPFSYVQYKTKGTRGVEAPGTGVLVITSGSSSWYTGEKEGISGGGYWFVSGSADLDTKYTKGLCRNYG